MLALAIVGCRPGAPAKPDVVVIVVESLRADHVGAYGSRAATTPRLDALARDGVRFAAARAPSSWTLPSVASLLTGLYPVTHGVTRLAVALSPDVATMPEAFRAAGYRTGAVSADPGFVTPLQGFGRGFDDFVVERGAAAADGRHGDVTPADPWLASYATVRNAEAVTRRALDWIAARDASAPYFLYLQYFDPHAGYFPPSAYAARFGVAADDPLRGDAQWAVLTATTPPDRGAVATLAKLYDAEIAYTDTAIGTLLDGVRARARPTIVMVVGDHGEELNEHGGLQHGRTLYDEVLRVPWIVTGAGLPAGGVVPSAVSLVSLWATVAELADLPAPPDVDGPSLVPLMRGDRSAKTRAPNVFADLEARFFGDVPRHSRAIVSGRWKLVPSAGRGPSFFDLDADPMEQIGVVDVGGGPRGMLEALLKVHERTLHAKRVRHPPRVLPPPK